MSDQPDRAADTDTGQDAPAAAPMSSAAASDADPLAGVMSGREAAAALNVSERTIRRAIQRGDLAATKHAGSFHITPTALEAYRRQLDTGQRVLSRAATPDRTDNNTAAAQDRASDTPHVAAAAEDTGQDAAAAIRVLRELLAEERQKSDRLLEASTIWQARAMQLDAELKALKAGPIAQDAGAATHEQPEPEPMSEPAAIERHNVQTPEGTLRRWWRRITGTE